MLGQGTKASVSASTSVHQPRLDPLIVAVVVDAVEALAAKGARVVPITMPVPRPQLAAGAFARRKCAIAHRETWPARRDEYGPELNLLLDMAAQQVTGATIAETNIERDKYGGRLRAVFRDVDLTPCDAARAIALTRGPRRAVRRESDHDGAPYVAVRHDRQPTITLHGGFDGNAMPIGFSWSGGICRKTCCSAPAMPSSRSRLAYASPGAVREPTWLAIRLR